MALVSKPVHRVSRACYELSGRRVSANAVESQATKVLCHITAFLDGARRALDIPTASLQPVFRVECLANVGPVIQSA